MSREASSPGAGAGRDVVRTTVALAVAWVVAKYLPSMTGGDFEESLVGVVIVAVSAALAWIGKKMRDDGIVSGGPV